jgi:SAM-dependent methyltransferase
MRGKDISLYTAPIDELFSLGAKTKPTFAVGDGGNEIGMGNFKKSIEDDLSLVPCVVKCEYPIIASVSNWGAYGFIAYLEKFYNQNILPTFNDVDNYLEYIVSLGSVDGVKSENVKSVDGKEWYIEKEILADLKTSIIEHHNTFTMADTYDENSKSQMSIGLLLVNKLLPSVADKSTLLDIGCGPGNLTNEIYKLSHGKEIAISGMDIDRNAIKKAQSNFPHINFFVGSFFTKKLPTRYDYIFSNEAIHWTPLIPKEFFNENGIIYYFFSEKEKNKYREWGLNNLKNTLMFIDNNVAKKAIIQFGLDGQLFNIYRVINETLLELFPSSMKDIKFPLFYPTFKEVKNIIENNTKLMIENHEIKTVDLTESSTDEILGFIKGFAHNSLIGVLGREKLNKVYDKLKQNIENDIEHIRKDQWNHCILELKTDI